jgi:hypothetical protein
MHNIDIDRVIDASKINTLITSGMMINTSERLAATKEGIIVLDSLLQVLVRAVKT